VLLVVLFLMNANSVHAQGNTTYPIGISNCGIFAKIDKSPTRAVTLNQGATEIMLALGLQDRMVGTAYLDDEIWPEFKNAYAKIPVITKAYPTAQVLMAYQPDFLFGSYASAFQAGAVLNYSAYFNKPCTTPIWHSSSKTFRYFCRNEIQAAGIQTYLQVAACEDASMRTTQISQDVIKREIWDIANIFGVQANAMQLIENIDQHFKSAFKVVSDSQTAGETARLKVLWIDSQVSNKNPMIAACCGAPNLIIKEAGGVNAFPELGKDTKATWASGNTAPSWDDIAKADPDVLVIIDASWDPADKKIFHLCNSTGGETKGLRAVQNRAFITVPFSGSTLGVKNGAVAYNLAEAMVAIVRGRTLDADDFSVVTINADGDAGIQATGDGGVRTYLKLPTVDINGRKFNLDEFCPGQNKLVVAPPEKLDSPFAVKLAVSLPLTKDAFDTRVQKAFRQVSSQRIRARPRECARNH
jgi:iron complex transport system substrate-binding protein